ncbi:uncharacterized protein LOC130379152 isoform X1 [Gadus chalcogrammus]|uniref:uncharacterized protein LOC130379152 isoform X1 n=2 Tax=Gadus chalcogrammus TaxID=1042646 RepID=UPI0024C26199|nr:uncharacterized protein LOC130379152 isoform X1 [Gadus chalcogrammus]
MHLCVCAHVCFVLSWRSHDNMTKAALAKLAILVVLIFIICIPEFFWWHRGSRVDFLCVPCRPAEECGWLRGRHLEDSGRETGRGGQCDPCLALGSDQPQPEPVCTAADRGNGTDPGSDYGGSNEDPGNGWFMCETDMEEAYFSGSSSMSDSPKDLEVWMVVQLEEPVHLNLVLHDQRNTTSSYLHPAAEPEEEADDRQQAFYCCRPPPPVPQLANRSRCLIQLANGSSLSKAGKQALPWELTGKKDEWGSVFRALWMALVGLLLLLVLTSLLAKVYRKRGKSKGGPLCGLYKESRLNGSCPLVDTPSGIVLSTLGLTRWTVPDTLLSGPVDGHDPSGSFTAHLHHRGHPSLSSISEVEGL